MSKSSLSASIDDDTYEKLRGVMLLTGRSKSSAVDMLLSKGYEVWLVERAKALELKAGVKA